MRPYAIGFTDRQQAFIESNRAFFDRFPHLQQATETAFLRSIETVSSVQSIVFHLGRVSVEDFMEILVLCGNGYGIGGLKLLRGMYERAVTARYLHQNPAEVDAFIEYAWISTQKLIDASGATGFNQETLDLVKTRAAEARPKFQVPVCEDCGTTRLNHTWSRLDFVSMAKKTGGLGELIAPAYNQPTLQAHSSAWSIVSRVQRAGDRMTFQSGPQLEPAIHALQFGHLILLDVLNLQHEHFGLANLEDQLRVCHDDYGAIWNPERETPPAP